MKCEICGTALVRTGRGGRPRRYCSNSCKNRWVTVAHTVPPMDPRQEARRWRQCREMLLEGYAMSDMVERFGEPLYSRVVASLTEEEQEQRHENKAETRAYAKCGGLGPAYAWGGAFR